MIELIINGMFIGIGTAIGFTITEIFIKPRITKIKKRLAKI